MGFLKTLLHWASNAWNLIAGIPGDIGQALHHLWNFIGSLHALLDHLISRVVKDYLAAHLGFTLWGFAALEELFKVQFRIASWILRHFIKPLRAYTDKRLAQLKAWVSFWLTRLWLLELQLYAAARRYALALVTAEKQQRITADRLEHAAMLRQVAAALATVQDEAATGYKSGNTGRVSLIVKLTDELATRNPVIRLLVRDLVSLLLDVIATENPLERAALSFLLTQIINRLGIDRVAGDLLAALIGPLAGHPNPKTLHDVTGDLARRVSALEAQWARYMEDGGPEVDQAGKGWRDITSLGMDAAMLAFLGAAVANPTGWAREVSGTAGALASDTIRATADLIRRV